MGALAQQLALAGLSNAVAGVIENALGASSSVTGQQLSEALVQAGLDNEAADVLAARILALPNGAVSSVGLNESGALVGPSGVVLDLGAAQAVAGLCVYANDPSLGVVAGGADTTSAFQAAMNKLTKGQRLILEPGKVYGVTNIIVPHVQDIGIEVELGGKAEIRILSGGDASYGVAPEAWVNNRAWVGIPVGYKGIVFNGNGVCARPLVVKNWNSYVQECEFTGSTGNGLEITSINKDGTPISNTNVNTVVTNPKAYANAGDGVAILGTKTTDIQWSGGYLYDNGGLGLNAGECAGLQMMPAPHTYNNAGGGARFSNYGFNSIVSGGYFEDSFEIASISSSTTTALLGPNNTHREDLKCTFGGAASATLTIASPVLKDNAAIVHNNNSASYLVHVDGGSSTSAKPIKWGGDFWIGRVTCNDHYASGIGGYLDGVQQPSLASHTTGPAPNKLEFWKLANNGTVTNVQVQITVPPQQTSGSHIDVDIDFSCVSNAYADFDSLKATISASWVRRQDNTAAVQFAQIVRQDATPGGRVSIASAGWNWTGSAADMTPTLIVAINHPTPSDRNASPIRANVRARHRYTKAMAVS